MATCTSSGSTRKISQICSWKPRESISSASSRMNRRMFWGGSTRLLIMSLMRPGVPTTACTPRRNTPRSVRMEVPPMHAWTCRPLM